MARKYPKKGRYSLRRVRITPELALATLASDTALVTSLTGNSTILYRCISIEMAWTWINQSVGDGPLAVGYAHNDYTVGEIKEAIESATAISPSDKIAQEKNNRLVRIIGHLNDFDGQLNGGIPVKTRLNWKITVGKSVNMFVYNENIGSLTTGSVVHASGNMWVKDAV